MGLYQMYDGWALLNSQEDTQLDKIVGDSTLNTIIAHFLNTPR